MDNIQTRLNVRTSKNIKPDDVFYNKGCLDVTLSISKYIT